MKSRPENLFGTGPVTFNVTSINNQFVFEQKLSQAQVPDLNISLRSLPNRKDYLGSWKELVDLLTGAPIEEKLEMKRVAESARERERLELDVFLSNIKNRSMLINKTTSINHITIAEEIAKSESNPSQSNAPFVSDIYSRASEVTNPQSRATRQSHTLDEKDLSIYKDLYNELIKIEKGEKNYSNIKLPPGFDPSQAIVLLNQSFNLQDEISADEEEYLPNSNPFLDKSSKIASQISGGKASAGLGMRTLTRTFTNRQKPVSIFKKKVTIYDREEYRTMKTKKNSGISIISQQSDFGFPNTRSGKVITSPGKGIIRSLIVLERKL